MKAQLVWWHFVIVEGNYASHQNRQAEETVKWLRILMSELDTNAQENFPKWV
jgi:hypothetical protein